MDAAFIVALAATTVAGCTLGFLWVALSDAAQLRRTVKRMTIDAHTRAAMLENLRSNCFLTNDRGHRVRYSAASWEAQHKAETTRRG